MTKINLRQNSAKTAASIVFMVLFAIIGVRLLTLSHAASPYTSIQANNGVLGGQATTQSDSSASDGQYVQFGKVLAVNPAPIGPTAPASGWHVDFADDFNTPLGTGTGQDNFWYPNQSWQDIPSNNAPGNNSNVETEVYNSSQVSVSGGNLVLTAKYQNNVGAAGTDQVQRNYVSGMVTTPSNRSGYKGFTWTPGGGSTWAFEIVCQWPKNTGELWNAWWTSSLSTWLNERDFFEGKSTSSAIDTDWIYETPNSDNGTGVKQQDYYQQTLAFDPSTAMHRYTYVVYPDQSWSFYIDGVLQTWVGANGLAPVESSTNTPMELLINYALRATTFTAGTRQFLINSVAVYQDSAHEGQFTSGGGIAPGTTIGN